MEDIEVWQWIVIAVIVLGLATAQASRDAKKPTKPPKYQQLPIVDGKPTCSKCGSDQFRVRRKTSTKVLFGVASMAGQAKHVACQVCGTMYKRP